MGFEYGAARNFRRARAPPGPRPGDTTAGGTDMNDPISGGRRGEAANNTQENRSRRVYGARRRCLVLSLVTSLTALQPAVAQTDDGSAGTVESAVVIDAFDAVQIPVEPAAGIDEIVVTAERSRPRVTVSASPFSDPLRERIRREVEQLSLLIDEYDWRLETVRISEQPPRIRWGYDPREHLRVSAYAPRAILPLDLVQPATVFTVGF